MLNLWRPRYALVLSCFVSCLCLLISPGDAEIAPQSAQVQATSAASTLNGTVSDPSGANIPHADVHIEGEGIRRDTQSDGAGRFTLALPSGKYEIRITANGFDPYTSSVTLTPGVAHPGLDARLPVAAETEEVTVPSDSSASTAASDNKSALVFKGEQLKTFSDDNAVFDKQIQALAGDDGSGPQIYVDGFSGGHFPPKNSIREIRINQNPYSAEYEELGYGRIEIFTKPGSDQLHGTLDIVGNDNAFNTVDPYQGAQLPYHSVTVVGDLSGPINQKTSLFLSEFYNDQQTNAAVHAFTLDANLLPITLSETVASPAVSSSSSARLDRQITTNNTLTARYELDRIQQTNGGVGLLVLPEAGTNSTTTTQTLQVSDNQIIGTKMISDAHFQYLRTRLEQSSVSAAPSLNVEGAFTGNVEGAFTGGGTRQITSDNQDRYEFQEIFTRQEKAHFLRFGGRYRLLRDANLTTVNYNGAFTFPSLTAYQITQQVLAANPGVDPMSLDHTIRTKCVAQSTGSPICGGATQFSITTGQPSAVVLTGDLGLFAEDEWKVSKSFTLDYGLRFETQSAIPDHFDPAPRVGFAWAVGQAEKKPAIITVRGGGGIFYDRFASGNILTAIRQQSGTLQPSFYVTNPKFYPDIPSTASLSNVLPTLYNISPHLRSEYSILGGIAVERSLWKIGSITVNYLHSHDVHQWDSVNLNAPLPGTYVPPDPTTGTAASGTYPLGTTQAVYQFQSGGVSNRDRLFTNINLQPTKNFNLFAFYVIRHQDTDATSATGFPSNSYDIAADYGRATRPGERLFVGGFWQLPFGLSMNAFLSASDGTPFNITTGTDLNGDTQYNDRPAFATDLTRPSVVKTRLGNFDTSPIAGQRIIPSNYGTSPAFVDLDFGAGKSIKFGPRPTAPPPSPGDAAPKGPVERPDPRYSIAFSFDAENILNHVNNGLPVGVLTSPSFGQSISLASPFGSGAAANRVISLHTTFSF
jgi:hypothetical protein